MSKEWLHNLGLLLLVTVIFVFIYSAVMDIFNYDLKFTCGMFAGSVFWHFKRK